MAIVEVTRPVTGGVDTHLDAHVAAVPAIAMVDLSGRAKKSCPESSTGTDGSPSAFADQRSAAFPGVGGRAQGPAHPSALSILGLKLTSSTCGR